MRDPLSAEFPDLKLLNRHRQAIDRSFQCRRTPRIQHRVACFRPSAGKVRVFGAARGNRCCLRAGAQHAPDFGFGTKIAFGFSSIVVVEPDLVTWESRPVQPFSFSFHPAGFSRRSSLFCLFFLDSTCLNSDSGFSRCGGKKMAAAVRSVSRANASVGGDQADCSVMCEHDAAERAGSTLLYRMRPACHQGADQT